MLWLYSVFFEKLLKGFGAFDSSVRGPALFLPAWNALGQGCLQKMFAYRMMLASNGAEHRNLLGYSFFSLIRCVCVNLKSILILSTVVERVINRQSKAHESSSKVLFLSCHWPAAWCLGELYPRFILVFLTAKWRLYISSWHILELPVQLSAIWVFQHDAVYTTRMPEGWHRLEGKVHSI